jgi:transposase-like protein
VSQDKNEQPGRDQASPSQAERSELKGSAAQRGRPGRRTVDDKKEAVLQLLAGKASVDQLAHRFGVRPETVEGWRTEALEGVDKALRAPGKSARERELEKKLTLLEAAFTDLAIRHELVERALASRPSKPGRSSK